MRCALPPKPPITTSRMEIGELDDQGNLVEVEPIATLTLLRIEE